MLRKDSSCCIIKRLKGRVDHEKGLIRLYHGESERTSHVTLSVQDIKFIQGIKKALFFSVFDSI